MQVYGFQWDSTTMLPFIGGAITAKYINGAYASRPVHFGRGVVWIDVDATSPWDAHWLDIETGDAKPQDFPRWNNERRQGVGQWGGFYCNRDTLPEILHELPKTMPADLWLATLDGDVFPDEVAALPPNVRLIAVQAFGCQVPNDMVGFHANASLVFDQVYWDGRHA